MPRFAVALLLIAAAAAAAIGANLALLGYASERNDPVGKLSIHASLPRAPASVIRPEHEETHEEGDD
ncbi:MAG: hypothetical protein ACXWYS_02470 [Gaiellaceae bacterium]